MAKRKMTPAERSRRVRELEGEALADIQARYGVARLTADDAAEAKLHRKLPAEDAAPARLHRELEAIQYQACSVCGAEAGTACVEGSRRHLGVVADQVHPGRRLLDPRKSLPRGGL